MPKPAVNEVGKKYGKLTVVKRAGSDAVGCATFLCQCECGGTIVTRGSSLRQGITRSCGCLAHLPLGDAAFNQVYNSARQGAKARGYEWKLTKERVKEIHSKPCFYCGEPPCQTTKDTRYHGQYTYNGIDRLDNTMGYLVENVVPCCGRCNRAKDTHGVESFRQWVISIYNHWAMYS